MGDSTSAARGLLAPVLRTFAHHLRLQLRDAIQAVFADHREYGKVVPVLLHRPGHHVFGQDEDFDHLAPPQMPRYPVAVAALVDAAPAHAPGRTDHPLRFALETDSVPPAVMHNAPSAPEA